MKKTFLWRELSKATIKQGAVKASDIEPCNFKTLYNITKIYISVRGTISYKSKYFMNLSNININACLCLKHALNEIYLRPWQIVWINYSNVDCLRADFSESSPYLSVSVTLNTQLRQNVWKLILKYCLFSWKHTTLIENDRYARWIRRYRCYDIGELFMSVIRSIQEK